MKIEDIRAKTDSELEFDMTNLKKELFDARFRASMGTDANTGRVRDLRRSVARIQTVLHERALGVRGAAAK
ncbi:MAG: 50S ribosomal protein L29 [Planctomycetes bacterium]|jgi:large subunit ribosomal protein L29|nr:50S ribosomal protein L29 [Planctomycetota bacterium]MDA8592815.1 50S ribosomal protein L29 [Planctomycetota bacterium]MDA8620807.1 50S ribosomal protein L29 [Planctomycetota bacterium]MDB4733957.1 50S ribosomal protein L29 [Planctomycetota bacterium]